MRPCWVTVSIRTLGGAATSLARMRAARDERSEAKSVLAPVYGWFTEGFDTADLKSAKALLDELA